MNAMLECPKCGDLTIPENMVGVREEYHEGQKKNSLCWKCYSRGEFATLREYLRHHEAELAKHPARRSFREIINDAPAEDKMQHLRDELQDRQRDRETHERSWQERVLERYYNRR